MNKVITISLNGKAYKLEEDGCKALQQYLDQASSKLSDNPDKEEVINDLEQAFAEKCDQYLFPHKDVVLASEIQTILEEMGPVDPLDEKEENNGSKENFSKQTSSKNASANDGSKSNEQTRPKRLYQILEGSYISGVCNGLAVYFEIDVTLVRIIFVILAILTNGAWILVYVVMMFIVPVARTADQKAEAHGQVFNVAEFIQNAKERYRYFENDTDFKKWKEELKKKKREWRDKKNEWREWWYENKQHMRNEWQNRSEENKKKHQEHNERVKEMHRQVHEAVKEVHKQKDEAVKETHKIRNEWKDHWKENYDRAMKNYEKNFMRNMSDHDYQFYRASMVGTGFFSFLGSLVLLVLTVIWGIAMWSLFTTHYLFGFALGVNDPLWMVYAFVTAVFLIFFLPFKLLVKVTKRRVAYMPFYSSWGTAWTTFIWLLAIGTAVYTGMHLYPQLNDTIKIILTHLPWSPTK